MTFPKQESALTSPKYSDVCSMHVLICFCHFYAVFILFLMNIMWLHRDHSEDEQRSSLLNPQCIAVKAVAHFPQCCLNQCYFSEGRKEKKSGLLRVCVFI